MLAGGTVVQSRDCTVDVRNITFPIVRHVTEAVHGLCEFIFSYSLLPKWFLMGIQIFLSNDKSVSSSNGYIRCQILDENRNESQVLFRNLMYMWPKWKSCLLCTRSLPILTLKVGNYYHHYHYFYYYNYYLFIIIIIIILFKSTLHDTYSTYINPVKFQHSTLLSL